MPAPLARSPWRRALAGGAVVLALSGLAACGGGSDSGDSSNNAFSVGGSSSSASSTGSSAPSAPDLQPGDSVSKDQMADLMKTAATSMKTAHVTMNMDGSVSGQSMTVKAQGDMQVSPMAEHLTMDLMGQQIEVLMVDNTMYMKSALLGGGDKWAKADLSALGGAGLSDAMSNPLSLIDKMADAVTSATYKGEEKVAGTDTKHYTYTVDTKKAVGALGTSASEAAMPDSISADIWIDDQGRMVQSKTAMGSTGTVTMTMSDFDKDVSISAPPSDQVTDLPTP